MVEVEIPETFIERFRGLGRHFIRVSKHGKEPVDKGWTLNPMFADDPKLQAWLKEGGNYGVVGGFGLVIVDIDIEELKQIVKGNLPLTFTVQSPGSKGWHLYFLCSLEKPIRLRDKDGENIGDIQGQGKMVVGPGSVHPNGGIYKVVDDRPLAQVTRAQLIETFKEFVVPDREIEKVEATARLEKRETKIDLDVLQVVPLAGLHRRGDEYFGPHPVHGSETGRNFSVNPAKNCWHCFRHGTGGGPLLWRAVEEGIIDCSEAGPGALRGETFKQVLEKAKERGYIKDVKPEEEKPIFLDHLNHIEDPNLAGKPVVVEAVVSSTGIAYLVPKEVEADYEDEEGNPVHIERKFNEKDYLNLKLVGVNEGTKYKRLNRRLRTKDATIRDKAWRSVYRIRIRPPVFTLEKRGEKIVDERGFEYKAHDIYITSDKSIAFQPSSLIQVEALALPNPKTQKTTLLAYKVDFPEEVRLFDIVALEKLKAKFQGMTVKQRLEWVLGNFEKYAQIVERRNLAEASFLCYFTPTWIHFNADLQKGWGNVLLCGDTTTAKSETLRKLISLLKSGMLITAETASTVGLTGTATQVEKEGWFVDWGFLVLLDRKLLAVDGAHKLSLSNWAVLAEAERSGVVAIAKAAKNTAYARTRQIKISNAVDREADKYSTKSLATFLYPCQALTTILDKTSIARLDLVVFADQRDVKAEDINKQHDDNYDPDLELMGEALKWCWSGTAQIRFDDEAVETLLKEATDLYNIYFCEMIPLASIDLKWKLARLSTALAYLTLSTEDFETLTVTKEHVEEVVEFLKDEYTKAGLNTLAQEEKFEVLSQEDVAFIINSIVNKTEGALDTTTIENVFKFIVLQGRVTRDQLMTRFGLSEKNQLRPLLAVLSNEKMVKSGRGLYPTPKLVQAYKVLNVAKVTKDTNLEREPPKKNQNPPEKNGESSHDLGNLGNLGKKSTVVKVFSLEEPYEGTCALCEQKKVLYHQVEKANGDWGHACQDCGSSIVQRLRKGDE